MPVYQTPGVYVEEVAGTPPIAGVGTSTAGFIGVSEVPPEEMPFRAGGPADPANPQPEERETLADLNDPQLVTNFEQFKKKFGNFHADNQVLAHAVFGFFLNGGTRCHVVRVAPNPDAAAINAALAELEKIDEIAILVAPGIRPADGGLQKAILDHCERENVQDRFAILDGQDTTTIDEDSIKPPALGVSNYGALYFPDIRVADQTPDAGRDARLSLPPSGHVAGVYARVDNDRGVHKAPANEVVRGALGLDYLVTRHEQVGLNPVGINVIRGFDGAIRIWGARTIGPAAQLEGFEYINVRRLFLFLRESIDEGTQFAVFEPNAPALWAQITRTVTAFLTNVWRSGALFGNTPEEAFFVKCNEETNPEEVRRLGQVITEIGVAPVFPAEFVIFRISQKTSGGE